MTTPAWGCRMHKPWNEGEKRACRKCGDLKLRAEFCVDKRNLDGVSGRCRKCSVLPSVSWQKRNKDKVKKIKAEFRARHRTKLAKEQKDRYWKDPAKFKARNSVYQALRRGKLKREACAFCQDVNTEAHHPDYNAPTTVVWVCRIHHAQLHKLLKNKQG